MTDKEDILKRWADHFDGVLNRPPSINHETINRLPQMECNPLLDEFPTVSETVKAIKLLSSGNTYKAGDPPVAETLTELFHIMWRKKPSLKSSRIQQLSTYSKGKGILKSVNNHRGISLSSIARKILARVLLNRLNEQLEQSGLLPESQCLSGKTEEQKHDLHSKKAQREMPGTELDLYMTFVDITKAFDTS